MHMPVGLVLLLAAAQGVAAPLPPRGGKAPFRLLYNNDATNVLSCESPFHEPGAPVTDAAIAGSIDEVAERGVDAYLLSPGLGHYPWCQGERVREHYAWWTAKTGLEPDPYGRYLLEGGDWVRVLVQRCRAHGMAPFVSFRMNDVHMMEFAGEAHPRSQWASRFYTEHPEYWIEPEHKTKWPSGYNHRRGLNWAEPAVREHKLAMLTELCEGYDLDGLELDFLRDHVLYRDEVPEAARLEITTGFVRQVRALLDRTALPGRRRWLCARVPLERSRWRETGLDVSALVGAGVEMLNCSGWYHTITTHDLGAIRKEAPGAALYQELTHSAGTMWFVAERSGYGTVGHPRTSDTMLYTVANLAYARGADGISLFNFVYTRSGDRRLPWLRREPPFQVLPHLRDPAWLALQPQHYWLGQWSYHNQLSSSRITAERPRTFRLDAALPKRPITGQARLRLHAQEPIPGTMRAALNGTDLEPTPDVSALLDYPYDAMLSDAPRRRAWVLPVDLVREGINEVRVSVDEDAGSVRVTWLDFALP
ncbi:MAG: hypothetical protein JXR77_10000 [Lentisphaeria bacterium]|nr:hypothetical protein [Lentisphaeria bacterium]